MFLRILFCFLVVSILFTGSCKKNDGSLTSSGSQRSDCYNFPLPTGGAGYNLVSAPRIWCNACFDPADNNQILYTVETPSTSNIYRTRLNNTNDTVLLAQFPLFNGAWNKSGWIAFWSLGGKLYKAKDNGDSLRQLYAYTTMNVGPEWSPDGKKIVVNAVDYTHNVGGLFILNADGSSEKWLDSIDGTNPVWSPDGSKIAYTTSQYMAYVDTVTNQKIIILNIDQSDAVTSMSWFPDSKWLAYGANSGLYKINIDTRQTVLLRDNCDSRGYGGPCVSNDGTKILVSRGDSKIIPPNTKYSEGHVYIMNADGSNEVKVNLK